MGRIGMTAAFGACVFVLTASASAALAAPRYSRDFVKRMGDEEVALLHSKVVFHSKDEEACWNLQATAYQVDCFAQKMLAWNRKLEKSYRRKLATLPPARRAVLVREQRRWDRTIEPFCHRHPQTGGTLDNTMVVACRFNVVYKRAHDIERFK